MHLHQLLVFSGGSSISITFHLCNHGRSILSGLIRGHRASLCLKDGPCIIYSLLFGSHLDRLFGLLSIGLVNLLLSLKELQSLRLNLVPLLPHGLHANLKCTVHNLLGLLWVSLIFIHIVQVSLLLERVKKHRWHSLSGHLVIAVSGLLSSLDLDHPLLFTLLQALGHLLFKFRV